MVSIPFVCLLLLILRVLCGRCFECFQELVISYCPPNRDALLMQIVFQIKDR